MSPVFSILLLLGGVLGDAAAAAPDAKPADLIVVAEDAPWLAPVAVPLAGRFRRQGRPALLVAAEFPPKPRANWLFTRASPQRVVVLSTMEAVRLGPVLPTFSPELVPLGIDPVYGSFAVAKRFWGKSRRVVAVATDDIEAILYGAVWADRLGAPLLLRERSGSKTDLQADLRDLAAEDLVVAVSDPQRAPPWAVLDGFHTEMLLAQTIQERLVAALGAENIHTLILARVPDISLNVGSSAWLAPYLCAMRGAPLILCRNKTTTAAEAAVDEAIRRYRLRPRSVTILAGYGSIGCELMEIGAEAEKPATSGKTPPPSDAPAESRGKYLVEREPCVPVDFYRAAPLGVGRIPLESLGEASLMFARGLVRERSLPAGPGRVLLVANSSANRKPLPLGEVISRVTGQEFKNFGIPLDEFYGRLADSPEVLSAAQKASLIIYEGHTAYQDLIYVPYAHAYVPDDYYEEGLGALENHTPDATNSAPEETAPPLAPLPPPLRKPRRLEGPLTEIPIVVLQGCDSLDDELLDRIDELGCAAVIGSVTPIHSGSGSMLVHAFANGLLRPGNTLGESLRDAQNFLFCLEELKVERGLKEFAKTQRVALSFHLWGDPELPVFTKLGRPQEKTLEAHWSGPEELTIDVPGKRFAKVGNARYSAHVFPGSQAIGLVKKQKDTAVRRVLCAYYFRLPMPEHFNPQGKVLQAIGGAPNQATYRVDPLGRFVLVTYLPEVEKAHDTIVLRWVPPGVSGR